MGLIEPSGDDNVRQGDVGTRAVAAMLSEAHDQLEHYETEIGRLNSQLAGAVSNPLDDPEAMARATEALQVSANMPHNRRAAYVIGAALNPEWGR